ncbi:sensor histidine kinase [Pseudonocardiaceae bacterium YIM PH 21723]|nr:sensor histidine kinase [Pseudonocardiaceae bacterium YIM PH 21723]
MTLVAALAVLGLFLMLCRSRRVNTSVEDATLLALDRMSQAARDLRNGLVASSTDKAIPHLRELLSCVAVGITDREGTMLTWAGDANDHYQDFNEAISKVLNTGNREYIDHDDLACYVPRCPMRYAVVAPLQVDDEAVGALLVIGSTSGKRLVRSASEVARYVSTQLELADLQESKERLAVAEVRALRAQISPHFIYNALNTIYSLSRTDPHEARELLMEFAEFTRYSFQTESHFTTLADELRNIDRYLTLEQARYGMERLKIQLQIAPEVLPVTVPFLALQPLVENAVRHGLASKPGGGTVSVIAVDNGAEALISVEDDGVGMDPEKLKEDLTNSHITGAHVGLGNIDHRIRAAFGNDYSLVVETNVGAGMKVTLRVPKFAPGVRAAVPMHSEDRLPPADNDDPVRMLTS